MSTRRFFQFLFVLISIPMLLVSFVAFLNGGIWVGFITILTLIIGIVGCILIVTPLLFGEKRNTEAKRILLQSLLVLILVAAFCFWMYTNNY